MNQRDRIRAIIKNTLLNVQREDYLLDEPLFHYDGNEFTVTLYDDATHEAVRKYAIHVDLKEIPL
jgi:hypothetical protein